MNRIQNLFFENLKQIFNSYNTFLEKVERENKIKIIEINKAIEEASLIVYYFY
jgi:hypothetical protein